MTTSDDTKKLVRELREILEERVGNLSYELVEAVIQDAADTIESLERRLAERDARIAELEKVRVWADELHLQLEKLWYTPAGRGYSDAEADAVINVLGPTDECLSRTDESLDQNLFRAERWCNQRVAGSLAQQEKP